MVLPAKGEGALLKCAPCWYRGALAKASACWEGMNIIGECPGTSHVDEVINTLRGLCSSSSGGSVLMRCGVACCVSDVISVVNQTVADNSGACS